MPITQSRHIPLAHSLLSAGAASEIYEEGYTLLDINASITNGRDGYLAFTVTGDSMVPTIPPGSVVIVDTYRQPRSGDAVIAVMNGGDICVKIFHIEERKLYLVPENESYKPRELTVGDDFRILGTVKAHLMVYY